MLKYFLIVLMALVGPATAATAEESPSEYCARVIADAEKGPSQMFEAGLLYYHGMHMGKHCVTVDYVKAFELLRRAGATRDLQSLLNDLTDKANSGNPRAVSAIRELEKRGWIEKVRNQP